jgi:septum formation protein
MATIQMILASNSPRRQELLGVLGLPFTVRAAPADGETPAQMVLRLARDKACATALRAEELLIAADTTVELDGQVLGKPVDRDDARRMLEALRGRPHAVHTGLALRSTRSVHGVLASTTVAMRCYGAAELRDYLDTGSPLDKAGAYGIQDEPFAPAEHIDGCYLNVMGLPLCHLARALLDWGVALPALPPPYCRQILGRPCPAALF